MLTKRTFIRPSSSFYSATQHQLPQGLTCVTSCLLPHQAPSCFGAKCQRNQLAPTHVLQPILSHRHLKHGPSKPVLCTRPCSLAAHVDPAPHTAQTHHSAPESLYADPDNLYRPDLPPSSFLGPVQLQYIPGSGLGYVACQDLRPGELLLVCRPLVILHSKQAGTSPSGTDLVDHMLGQQYNQWQVQWMRLLQGGSGDACDDQGLDDSSSSSSSGRDPAGSSLPGSSSGRRAERLSAALGLIAEELAGQSGANGTTPGPEGGGQLLACPWDRDLLSRVSNCNSFSHYSQDAGVVSCRQLLQSQYPGGHTGLFPCFSLLNHSCCPNAWYMVVGDHMVVRAAAHVAAGEEVCISYIGPRVFQPLAQRREYLLAAYGFRCCCPRCSLEEGLPAELTSHISDTYRMCEMMTQVVDEATKRRDFKMIDTMGSMVRQYRSHLQHLASQLSTAQSAGSAELQGSSTSTSTTEAVRSTSTIMPDPVTDNSSVLQDSSTALPPAAVPLPGAAGEGLSLQQLQWLEASLYVCLQLQLEQFGAAGDRGALSTAVEVVAAVAPGSDLHVHLASQWLLVSLQHLQDQQQQEGEGKQRSGSSKPSSQAGRPMRQRPGRGGGARRSAGVPASRKAGSKGRGEQSSGEEGVRAQAERACYDAYVARYGLVSFEVFGSLLLANLRQRQPQEQVELVQRLVLGA